MTFTYDVKKRKANRISYRILGLIFTLIALLQCITLFHNLSKHPMLTMVFAVMLGSYGLYLFIMSFRRQAYDITYKFSEDGMLVKHKYGETMYTFEDIEFITMIIPDESLIYYILNIKAKNDIYTIPFTNKREFCEKVYDFVNERIKHDEDDVIYIKDKKNKQKEDTVDDKKENSNEKENIETKLETKED
ncbi:MAG: hypothetical protein IJ167_04985 [Lachnospiraceae bacterium]|nr:hypothetical protein [Lachnospiraceae bacterium]